jgi:hypothetical protein
MVCSTRSALALMVLLPCVACTNNMASVGGAVSGPIDNHCYLGADGTAPGGPIAAQPINVPACYPDAGLFADGGPPPAQLACGAFEPDGGPDGCTPQCLNTDGGPAGCAADYGATMYNSSGTDDDCKYQTGWTSTPIFLNGSTTFTFTALHTVDGTPATGANVFAEVYLPSENYISKLNINPPVSETPPGSGVYSIGPITFDRSGTWTVRFHLNENCLDILPDSPHGHAAYYINVP